MKTDYLGPAVLGFALSLAPVGQRAAEAAPQFTLLNIGVLPSDSASAARAINDFGQVVGDSTTPSTSRPYFWTEAGGIQPLSLSTVGAPVTYAQAFGIDSASRIIGSAPFRGLLWDGSLVTDLTTLPGGLNFVPRGIGSNGTVVGSNVNLTEKASFLNNGSVDPLTQLNAGDSFSRALAINSRGEIAGQSGSSAVVWISQAPLELSSNASATAINDANGIAGVSTGTNPNPPGGQTFQAVIWLSGVRHILTNPSGIDGSVAAGINDANDVVGFGGPTGFFPTLNLTSHRALLWEAGIAYDLNQLVTNGSDWTLLQALDVNNRGEIVGIGLLEGQGLRGFVL